MAHDDFDVIVYKVLKYFYECIKQGIKPNVDKAHEIAKCNDEYWSVVLAGMIEEKLLSATQIPAYGKTVIYKDLRITNYGARYVKENSKMKEVEGFLGKAFSAILQAAINATMAL